MQSKSPEMNEALDHLTRSIFGRSRSESIEKNLCVTCGTAAVEFKDETSRREYIISGMCQTCQDKTFGRKE